MNQTVMLPMQVGLATLDKQGLIRKQILPSKGVWRWPGQPHMNLEIDEKVLDDVVRNFEDGVIDTVPFVKVEGGNGAHSEDPEQARGVIESLERTDDGLYAHIRPINDEVAEVMLGTKLGASPSLRFGYKDHGPTGADKGVVLRHVAWTPEPWISGLKTFEQVAMLSAGEDAKDVVFLEEIAPEKGGKDDMNIEEQLAELSSKIEAQFEERVASLSTQVEELGTQNTALNEQVETLKSQGAQAVTTHREREIDAMLSARVKDGLPPAIRDVAHGILMADAKSPVTVNLSAGEDGEPTEVSLSAEVERLLDLLPKVSFEEVGDGKVEGMVMLSTEDYKKLGLSTTDSAEADEGVSEDLQEAKRIRETYIEK